MNSWNKVLFRWPTDIFQNATFKTRLHPNYVQSNLNDTELIGDYVNFGMNQEIVALFKSGVRRTDAIEPKIYDFFYASVHFGNPH